MVQIFYLSYSQDVADFAQQFPELAKDLVLPLSLTGESRERVFSSVLRVGSPGVQLWTHYDVGLDKLLASCHKETSLLFYLFPFLCIFLCLYLCFLLPSLPLSLSLSLSPSLLSLSPSLLSLCTGYGQFVTANNRKEKSGFVFSEGCPEPIS